MASVWWFISDLHLGAGVEHSRRVEAGLSELLLDSVLPDPRTDRHLVLLGDVAELSGGRAASRPDVAIDELDAIAATYPAAFAALSRCLVSGVVLHVVVGNHDIAWGHPDVQERLRQHLGSARRPDLAGDRAARDIRFHPWVLYVPGLVYAEHGHQHHQFNRFALLLASWSRGRQSPPATPIAAWGDRGATRLRRMLRLVAALATTYGDQRRSTREGYRELVRQAGRDEGLPEALVNRVYDVSNRAPLPTVIGLFRRVIARRLGLEDHDSYLRRAADHLAHVLSASQQPPSYYIFGHTHRAALRPLASGRGTYINCGTWFGDRGSSDQSPLPDHPFVVLEWDGHQARGRLHRRAAPGLMARGSPP